jgi:osmotically-inducible protein OsmY
MPRSDEQIKKNVVDQLYWDDRVDASQVDVEVLHGEVTLKGWVPTYLAKSSAFTDSWSVLGVESVRNELSVKYAEHVTSPSDDEIKTSVDRLLTFNPDIEANNVETRVDRGIVTLSGSVDAFWKKLHAEELVSHERGVLGIDNKLAIVPERNFVDNDIARDIISALERNVLVSAEDVAVEVDNGDVTLRGTVPTWSARNAAYEAARYTAGVLSIRNEVSVASPEQARSQ